MELRYVYRRIEDDIGAPLDIEDSPHAELTRQLRHAFREVRDIARHTELNALCLAALSGNDKVDAMAMSSKITDIIDQALYQCMPYIKKNLEKQPKKVEKSDYDLAFERLAEFTKELNEGKAGAFKNTAN